MRCSRSTVLRSSPQTASPVAYHFRLPNSTGTVSAVPSFRHSGHRGPCSTHGSSNSRRRFCFRSTEHSELLYSLKCFERGSLGALGLSEREHVAPVLLLRSRRVPGREVVRQSQPFGSKPPALAPQLQVLLGVRDQRLVFRRHVVERLQTYLGRLQLGLDRSIDHLGQRLGADSARLEPIGRRLVRTRRVTLDRNEPIDFRPDIGNSTERNRR